MLGRRHFTKDLKKNPKIKRKNSIRLTQSEVTIITKSCKDYRHSAVQDIKHIKTILKKLKHICNNLPRIWNKVLNNHMQDFKEMRQLGKKDKTL